MLKRFNIRVYGILIQNSQVLLSKERTGDLEFIKFPGGGLEFGEGTGEALKREFMEEAGIEVEIDSVYHVNQGLITSAFNAEEQLVSLYFKVSSKQSPTRMELIEERWGKPYFLKLYWENIENIHPDTFRWPVDKEVEEKLRNEFAG